MESLPISVVIVAKNAEKTIGECLSSVQRNNPAEIIVVDGHSTDRTVAIAREYTNRIYSDSGKGLGYARQLGAEQATEEYVTYVDSEVILTDGALVTMLAEFQRSKYISMRAQVSPDTKCANYWEWAQLEHHLLRRPRNFIGMATCMFKRETILKYGFDVSEKWLDDMDLELRLRRDGHQLGTSSALIYRGWETNLKSLARYRFFLGRVEAHYIRKHGPWHSGFWPPLATLYWLTFCLIKGKPKLIPYLVVDGITKTTGMVKGAFELIAEAMKRRQKSAV